MKDNSISVDTLSKYSKLKSAVLIGIVIFSFILDFIISLILGFQLYQFLILFVIISISLMTISDFVITKNENNMNFRIKLIFEIVTILILMGQLTISINQTQIQATQTRILEQTSQSNFPDLYLVSSWGYKSYPIGNLEKSPQSVGIGITNTGKSIAPFIRVEFVDGIFSGWDEETQNDFVIKDLRSFEYNETTFKFAIENHKLNNTTLTPGKFNLLFNIECAFSQTPKKFQNITICLYSTYDKIKEECGEEWSY